MLQSCGQGSEIRKCPVGEWVAEVEDLGIVKEGNGFTIATSVSAGYIYGRKSY